jgi:hypothetical protein
MLICITICYMFIYLYSQKCEIVGISLRISENIYIKKTNLISNKNMVLEWYCSYNCSDKEDYFGIKERRRLLLYIKQTNS